MAGFISPNLYQVSGGGLHVSYSTTGIDGQAHFHYQDSIHSVDFSGAAIRTIASEVGIIVTVTIQLTVDSGSTSFSLFVPVVNLTGPSGSAPINTFGITTIHRFSIVQTFMAGQIESYSTTTLSGTAQQVIF
jgi:hypothetical protein